MPDAPVGRVGTTSRPMPKWEQVHQDLMRRIGRGEFDQRFPGEHELAEEYRVSRHTVREALRRLRDVGLLASSRGRESKVNARAIEQPLGSLYSLFREVEARGHVQESEVIAVHMTTDSFVAGRLGQPEDTELFFLERLRRADGELLAHDRVWLPSEIGRPLLGADFSHAALYDELTRLSGVRPTGGVERVTAIVPSPAQRALLELPKGVACFEIERLGQVRDLPPIEYRISIVRADRYALTTTWSPTGYAVGAAASQSRLHDAG